MIENKRKNIIFNIFIIVFTTIFIIIAPCYAFAEEETTKLGDINTDGKIDTTDLVIMLRHISAKKTNKNKEWILTEEKEKIGDINKNDEIDSSDVLAILRYIAANKSKEVANRHKEWLVLEEKEKEEEEEKEIAPEKIELNQQEISMKKNQTTNLIVKIIPETANIKKNITWSSSNNDIATINENGIITAKQEGKAVITAKTENGKTATCTILVKETIVEVTNVNLNKTKLMLNTGNQEKLIATIEPTNATNQEVSWSSSDNKIATVENNGTVTAKGEGTTEITVKTANGKTATCTVTVKNGVIEVTDVKLNKTSLNLKKEDGERLIATIQPTNATNQEITWSSSNNNVATVSKEGFITAKGEGTATITAKTANGKAATCTVTIKKEEIKVINISLNKTNLKLKENDGERLIVTTQPTNATNQEITWSSSNSKIVTVNSNGFVTAKKEGTANIIAKTADGKTATCKVTVKKLVIQVTRVVLDTTVLMLDKDHYNTANLKATIEPNNATNKKVTWKSSNEKVATVNSNGKITAKAEGTAKITVKTANGKTATCQITVIGQMKRTSPGNGVEAKINASGWWIVKKVKWTREQLESYINNAAKLCETGDYNKYPEAAPAARLPYYTGAPYKNLTKRTLSKKKGISATNYLILVTTTNQQINVFHKDSQGKWDLVNSCETSTGNASHPSRYSHNRFEFYLGAIYPVPGNDLGKGNSFIEFSQSGRGWHGKMYNIEKSGQEPYCAHRALHYGVVYSNGAPSSAGCIHLPNDGKFYKWLNNVMAGQYGTRIIVY